MTVDVIEARATTPTSINDRLQDVFLRRAIRLSRVENACVHAVRATWRRLSAHIRDTLRMHAYAFDRSRVSSSVKPALDSLLSQIYQHILVALPALVGCLDDDLPLLAELQLRGLPALLQREINNALDVVSEALHDAHDELIPAAGSTSGPISVSFSSLPTQQIAELLASPLGGSAYAHSFADLGATVLRRLRGTLASGLLRGDSVPVVTRRVAGLLDTERWAAERIVRSEYVRVANQAALIVFDQNKRLLKGVRWVSTLDKRTCPMCGALDGKMWADPSKAKRPVTSTHGNCRCILIPVIKAAKDLGLTGAGGARAAFDGQVPATTTYTKWFGQQPVLFQRDVLGPTRYKLYRSGEWALKDFSTARGVTPIKDLLRR